MRAICYSAIHIGYSIYPAGIAADNSKAWLVAGQHPRSAGGRLGTLGTQYFCGLVMSNPEVFGLLKLSEGKLLSMQHPLMKVQEPLYFYSSLGLSIYAFLILALL